MPYQAEIERLERKFAEAEGEIDILRLQPDSEMEGKIKTELFIYEQMIQIYAKMIKLLRSLDNGPD